MTPRAIKSVIAAVSLVLLIVMVAAPFTAESGSFTALDGDPGVIDHADLWNSQNTFTRLAYTFGDFVCHQEQARLFMLNGSEMPICVRDVAILVGLIIGCIITIVYERSEFLNRNAVILFVVLFGIMIADWAVQHIFTLNVPFTRIVTGISAGIGIMILMSYWLNRRFYTEG